MLGTQLAEMARPDAEMAALLRALFLRAVRDALAEQAGKAQTIAEALKSSLTWPHDLVPILSRPGLCRLVAPALRALSPGTLAALVGMGGLKPLVAALGPAIAPLLGSLLKAAGGSLWARMGQPMGTTDGPRLVEVANEIATMYRADPDAAGIVAGAAQTSAAAISGVLASSLDRAGTEQAAAAARILAEAAAAAPNLSGEALARAFIVSGVPQQLFALLSTGSDDSSGGGGKRFAREEAILALDSIASLIPDHIGKDDG